MGIDSSLASETGRENISVKPKMNRYIKILIGVAIVVLILISFHIYPYLTVEGHKIKVAENEIRKFSPNLICGNITLKGCGIMGCYPTSEGCTVVDDFFFKNKDEVSSKLISEGWNYSSSSEPNIYYGQVDRQEISIRMNKNINGINVHVFGTWSVMAGQVLSYPEIDISVQ